MKAITLLLFVFLGLAGTNESKKQSEIRKGERIEKVINSHWTFNYFPSEAANKGYESAGFSDVRWPAISIPHTWNSYETTGDTDPFSRSPAEIGDTYWWTGWGWYRKHFSLRNEYSDRKIFIEFDGVQKYCKVWVNGQYAGDHKGGYGSFDFDITGFVKPGEDNLLAVAVSNLQKDEFRIHPLAPAVYNSSCGICRDVKIVVKDKLYIPMQGSASHEGGTFISTPYVSESEGIVRIKTWVKNDYQASKACVLQTTITDNDNKVVQVIKTEAVINAGQLYMFDQVSKPVKKPRLWSDKEPYLYNIHSEIYDKREVTDSYSSSFGFRWFRMNEKEDMLYLNNSTTKLKGVNHHQQYPWLGDAIPEWITDMEYTDITEVKGYNYIRTDRFPGDGKAFRLADEKGILMSEDFSAFVLNGYSVEEQKQQVKEMIRRDRNHPSLLNWSLGGAKVADEILKCALSEDSTRLISQIRIRNDSSFSSYIFGIRKINPSNTGSEPARIVVTSTHKKIPADRGSVAIITADILDANGNPVPAAGNSLKWKVTGPATLAGPSAYESVSDSIKEPEEGKYRVVPAANLIRSTGITGRIVVSVFSAGLASGSIEINSEEIIPDNQVIIEPVLTDNGRKPVAGLALNLERLEEIPMELAFCSEDFSLPEKDLKGYAVLMKDQLIKSNPSADTLTCEFKALTALLARHLVNNKGRLTAADYNFNIDHYNNCRLISGYILKTKLPTLFKESLREYYADLMINNGCERNAGEEMNWLNWIPSGGIVVIVPAEGTSTRIKGVVYAKNTGLYEIIRTVYPQFSKFSPDARERALVFISKMNPSVRITSSVESTGKEGRELIQSGKYKAEKGKPILIPDYKFISE